MEPEVEVVELLPRARVAGTEVAEEEEEGAKEEEEEAKEEVCRPVSGAAGD